jgi:hypothetical protein
MRVTAPRIDSSERNFCIQLPPRILGSKSGFYVAARHATQVDPWTRVRRHSNSVLSDGAPVRETP